MNIKHQELEIDPQNPFGNCKLEREKYATVLTEIVKAYPQGFTLAINNEWGTGKTTFIKMWQQQLIKEGFKTVYFNAWENDFVDDPLVAIMSELKTLIGKQQEDRFKKIAAKGAALSKHIIPAVAKAIINKYIDSATLQEILVDSSKGAAEIFEHEISEYALKKTSVQDFRKELSNFLKKTDADNPVMFIVDELDRCRPDYAVRVLEHLKHFFSVEGIIFVLSIDKGQLSSSIRGFYGSEQINGDEYLRRFIDLEYSIPRPSNKVFCNYLFNYFQFSEYMHSSERQRYDRFQSDKELILKMAETICTLSNATLRQQEKIFGLTRLILNSFQSNQYIFAHLLFFLVYVKTMRWDLYKMIEDKSLSYQQLSDLFCSLVPLAANNLYNINFEYLHALLLHLYSNGKAVDMKSRILLTDESEKKYCEVKSSFETDKNNSTLLNHLISISNSVDYHHTNLDYLLSRINLTEPFAMLS